MANFEAFREVISSIINLLFLKSDTWSNLKKNVKIIFLHLFNSKWATMDRERNQLTVKFLERKNNNPKKYMFFKLARG